MKTLHAKILALLVVVVASATSTAKPPSRLKSAGLPPAAVFGRVAPSTLVVIGEGARGPSQGSCVVIASGEVVTNYHVVQGAGRITVRRGKKSYRAKLGAFNPQHDLALLKVNGLKAPRVIIRPSEGLKVGERVYAVGAPHGLELSLSDGLIAALRKKKDGVLIQTTAPVSPGSSGGGLFDRDGCLVGIITYSRRGQNLNFAHPTEWIVALRGKSPMKGAGTPPPRFSIGARPRRLACNLTTESVWGPFSGGAALLSSRARTGSVSLARFDTQLPLVSSNVRAIRAINSVVLDDLNKKAGFAVFGTLKPGPVRLFFVQDSEGKFQLTIVEAFSFHNRLRFRTCSGGCKQLLLTVSKTDGAGVRLSRKVADLVKCIGLTISVRLRNGEMMLGKMLRKKGGTKVVETSRGIVPLRPEEILAFSCR